MEALCKKYIERLQWQDSTIRHFKKAELYNIFKNEAILLLWSYKKVNWKNLWTYEFMVIQIMLLVFVDVKYPASRD